MYKFIPDFQLQLKLNKKKAIDESEQVNTKGRNLPLPRDKFLVLSASTDMMHMHQGL